MVFKKISIILAFIITVSTVIGIGWKLDVRWSQAQAVESLKLEVVLLSFRFDLKYINERFNTVQERMWKLEDRYGGDNINNFDEKDRDVYRKLKIEKEELTKELDRLKNKAEKLINK